MPAPERCVAVVLHDVAPATWPDYAPLLAALDEWRVPLTLLVVPWWHGGVRTARDAAFRAQMDARVRRGDEIALHGWRHLDEAPAPVTLGQWWRRRVLTDREGEFAALDGPGAALRMRRGRAALAACGWRAEGFVAPAWQLSGPAAAALAGQGFAYTSTRDALWLLPGRVRLAAPCLVASARSAPRRWLSRHWNDTRARALGRASLVRLGLHPRDCAHPRLLAWWLAMLRGMLDARTAVTKAQWCRARMAGR